MANSIAFRKNYTAILDEVYQRASVSSVLNSGGKFRSAGRNAKEILIPKIEVTGLGDYTRNEGYKTGSIDFSYETKTFNYDRGIRLFADVMDVEEAGLVDCFVLAGSELQRTQVAPEADTFCFSQIASHTGVTTDDKDYSAADAEDVLADLRAVTSAMDEGQVSTGSRILFITPTLKGVLDDYSYANPNRSNRVMERFSRVVEVPQVRFYTAITLNSGESDQFGYAKASTGHPINFMVVEKSAVIKYDKHVASKVFSPDELESLDSYMMKYRKYGIVELLDNKLSGRARVCQFGWLTMADLVTYSFYLDTYGGSLEAGAFADAPPSAARCLRHLTGNVDASALADDDLLAYQRALCAAADAFAEFGEGRVGGYEIGDFKVTNYMEKGTTGREVAVVAALEELAGTGLAFCGVA